MATVISDDPPDSADDEPLSLQSAYTRPRFELIARFCNPNDELKVETFDLRQLRCVRMLAICWKLKWILILLNTLITFICMFTLEDSVDFWLSWLWWLLPVLDLYTWYRWAMNGVITGSMYYFYLCFSAASVHLLLVGVWSLGFMFGSFGWTQLFHYGSVGGFSPFLIVIDATFISGYSGLYGYTLYVLYKYMRYIGAPLSEPLEPA
jgi:hypothetical protein